MEAESLHLLPVAPGSSDTQAPENTAWGTTLPVATPVDMFWYSFIVLWETVVHKEVSDISQCVTYEKNSFISLKRLPRISKQE